MLAYKRLSSDHLATLHLCPNLLANRGDISLQIVDLGCEIADFPIESLHLVGHRVNIVVKMLCQDPLIHSDQHRSPKHQQTDHVPPLRKLPRGSVEPLVRHVLALIRGVLAQSLGSLLSNLAETCHWRLSAKHRKDENVEQFSKHSMLTPAQIRIKQFPSAEVLT
jgi:hypothetical protein